MNGIRVPAPGAARSYWLQEALAHDRGEPCPPLTKHVAADVCIVGGGFAGLWAAVELAQREPDLHIALLEQDICGGGASGRNGGFLTSSWWDAPAMCGLFGQDEGLAYATVLANTVGDIERWCEERSVDCWFHREGTLGVRTGAWQEGPGGSGPADFLAAHGLGDRMQPRTDEECRQVADSPRFIGGAFIEDGAVVQPARLARGLRRVALAAGVRIFERTEVTGLERSRPAVVRTEHAAVKADQVVLTMGSWAAGWRGFRRSFGVVVDHMVVTEPIPDRLAEIGWTSMTGIADGRELLYYLRPTDDGRIAIGGGALEVVMGGRASGRAATHSHHAAEVAARGLLWMFPQLEGIAFDYAWGGPIDQTASFLPFFKTLAPGNVHAGLGFSGHGLAQTRVGGRILSSLVQGVRDEWTALPVVGPEWFKAPPEPFRYPAVRAAAWAMEAGDRRQDEGRSRGILNDAIGSAPGRFRAWLVERGPRPAQ